MLIPCALEVAGDGGRFDGRSRAGVAAGRRAGGEGASALPLLRRRRPKGVRSCNEGGL